MLQNVEAFHRPGSIREALRLLASGSPHARLVAGGTDVIVQGDRDIRSLVDITRLGLSYIRRKDNRWTIGATTTLADLEGSTPLRALAHGILARAAALSGSRQVRNLATVGGNLANASPSADLAVPLLALDASVVLAGPRSRRTMPLASFFLGPRKTALNGCLLTEIAIPVTPRGAHVGWSLERLGRTAIDIALVSVAAGLQLDGKGRIKWARIALGSVAPTPVRALLAEELLTGRMLDNDAIHEACEEVARDVQPITDQRATADYRRAMAKVLTERALRDCAAQAGCTL